MRSHLEFITMLALIFTLLAGCTVNINPVKRSVVETVYYGEDFLEEHQEKAGSMEKTDVNIAQTIDPKTADPQNTDPDGDEGTGVVTQKHILN